MADQYLYIQVPKRQEQRAVSNTLKECLLLVKQSNIHITWMLEHADLFSLLWIIKKLKGFKGETIKGFVTNTIEVDASEMRRIIKYVLFLHVYRFRYKFRETSRTIRHASLEKIMKKLKVIYYYQVEGINPDAFSEWIEDKKGRAVEPYVDLLKIYNMTDPILCHYNSCLGKTLFINQTGSISICPYYQANVSLNTLESCSSIQDVFNTESFVALLREEIKRRDVCKNTCVYYKSCKGSCPLGHGEACTEKAVLQNLEEKLVVVKGQDKNPAIYEERARALSLKYRV